MRLAHLIFVNASTCAASAVGCKLQKDELFGRNDTRLIYEKEGSKRHETGTPQRTDSRFTLGLSGACAGPLVKKTLFRVALRV